jgi:hypothetical protein
MPFFYSDQRKRSEIGSPPLYGLFNAPITFTSGILAVAPPPLIPGMEIFDGLEVDRSIST